MIDQSVGDCKAVREQIVQGSSATSAPQPSNPLHMGQQQQQQQQPPPPRQLTPPPQQQTQRQPSLLDGEGPVQPQRASSVSVTASTSNGGEMDLLGGFGLPSPPSTQAAGGFGLLPPPATINSNSSNAPTDLMGAMGFGPSSDDMFFSSMGGEPSPQASSGGDLMGGMDMGGMMGGGGGGGGLDDLMGGFQSAPAQGMVHPSDDPFGGAFGAPMQQSSGGLAPPSTGSKNGPNNSSKSGRGASGVVMGGDLMGGGGLMEGSLGGRMGVLTDPTNGMSREELVRQREQQTAQAMQATVDNQRKQREAQESDRDNKRTIATEIKAKVDKWRQGKKNMRAILSTLHEIVPPGTKWEPVGLAKLLQPTDVKKAYRKALLVIHTDKLPETASAEDQVLAQEVFDAVREAWAAFQHEL
ncbi:DnaJ domain-containing protein [Pavlovales sp. CCMP2436]|nr:DnaJ domain-containing protein [Pavlovales sp. CCMP2436]